MLRHSGKAAREVGHAAHHVCHFLLTLSLMLSLGVLVVAWRLSRGPVDLGFLKDRVEAAVNASIERTRVTIGGVSVAWQGFSHGLDQPLILRITDLAVANGADSARVRVPVAEAGLSIRWLLIGRILPRAITLEGADLVLTRAEDGSVSFDVGAAPAGDQPSPLKGLLAVLGAPPETDRHVGGGRLSQLSAVSIHAAKLRMDDRLLNMTWLAERADIDLSRHPGGGMDGRVELVLALGDQKARLGGQFTMPAAARSAHVVAHLSPVTPTALATAAPRLASLAMLDAPVSFDAEADLGPDFNPTHLRLSGHVGAGTFNTAGGSVPLRRAEFALAGTLDRLRIETGVIESQPARGGLVSTITGGGQLIHRDGRLNAALHITLDRASFADLPALWPADVAPNARGWLSQNIQTGTVRDGKADLVLEGPDDGTDLTLTKINATLEGDDIAVTWLPTVPRVEQGRAHLVLIDPDKIEIDVRSGKQKVVGGDPLAVQNAHVTISGLSKPHQIATVRCDVNGSLASAIALLKEPRVRVLDRHPMDLRAPSGDARIALLAVVPLERDVDIDDVTIHATGTLNKAHLGAIAAGRDLDDAALAIDVDTNHLSVKGTGRLAGIPATIDALMDFRAGPPTQITQRYAVTGRATARALADAGLDAGEALAGEVGLNATLTEYRNGEGELTADADLTAAELIVGPLAWRKPVGGVAKGSARLTLSKERMTGLDRVTIDGPGIQVRGAGLVFGGKLDTVRLDRLALGRTEARGTIRLQRDGPIGIDLTGQVLDMSAKLQEPSAKRDSALPEAPPGPSWSMRGRFDRVLLARDQSAEQVTVNADSDGRVLRGLTLVGVTEGSKPFSVRIDPIRTETGRAVRRLTIDVADAGALLRGLDVTDTIQGGVMMVDADYDDTTRDHTLSGTLGISDFRVSRAPVLGKLLQAVTLYGLVDALGGPGLSFSRLTAPFQFNDEALVLRDARAFSPSLGLTAKGRIDRTGNRLDLEGTLVPAYVFNSMLGRIPVIGALFRNETGGGLFAMNYSLRGPIDDPGVLANPLSALTPGILRGMFGLFDQASPAASPGASTGRRAPLDRETARDNAQKP